MTPELVSTFKMLQRCTAALEVSHRGPLGIPRLQHPYPGPLGKSPPQIRTEWLITPGLTTHHHLCHFPHENLLGPSRTLHAELPGCQPLQQALTEALSQT